MNTVTSIFLHDLKALLRSPLAGVLVLMLLLAPAVFAWYSIGVQWNPSANTNKVKIAVVNEDAGASAKSFSDATGLDAAALSEKLGVETSETFNIGEVLVRTLQEDARFEWHVVPMSEGDEGLYAGEFYAELVLPKNFSSDMAEVMAGTLEQPTIQYWLNEKYSGSALELTSIEPVVSSALSSVFTGIVQEAASGVSKQGSRQSSSMRTGLDGAQRDLDLVKSLLDQASETIAAWRETVSQSQDALEGIGTDLPELKTALDKAQETMGRVRESSHEVTSAYAGAAAAGDGEAATVLTRINEEITQAVEDLNTKQATVDTNLAKAEKMLTECEKTVAALRKANPESKDIAALEQEIEDLQTELETLKKASQDASHTAAQAHETTLALSGDLVQSIESLKQRSDSYNTVTLPKLETSLDALSVAIGTLKGTLESLDTQAKKAGTLLDEFNGVLQKIDTAAKDSKEVAAAADLTLASARIDLSALANSSSVKKMSNAADFDVQNYGSFMVSPVKTQINQLFPLSSYGAGVAPLSLSIALWACCLLLVVVLRREIDARDYAHMRPWEAAFGRYLLLLLLAVLQAVITSVGVLVMGVQSVGPVSFIIASVFVSFCFMSAVYALNISLRHVGKALALVLLVVQVLLTAGIFPLQLMPELMQQVHVWLPFTYSLGALREGIGGFYSLSYLVNIMTLFAGGLVPLVLALALQPRALRVNSLFNRKLGYADIFHVFEREVPPFSEGAHSSLQMSEALVDADDVHGSLIAHMRTYAKRYAMVRQVVPLAILIMTVMMAIIAFVLNMGAYEKFIALVLYSVIVLIVFVLCIFYEHAYDGVVAQLRARGAHVSAMYADRMAADVAALETDAASLSGVDNESEGYFSDTFAGLDFDEDEITYPDVEPMQPFAEELEAKASEGADVSGELDEAGTPREADAPSEAGTPREADAPDVDGASDMTDVSDKVDAFDNSDRSDARDVSDSSDETDAPALSDVPEEDAHA